MAEIENPQLQELFDEVQKGYAMPIHVEIAGPASGVLTHDQSHQKLEADGSVTVQITDTTAVDYTLSHELLHMYFTTQDVPLPQYQLLTGDPSLDRQFYATSTALYDAAMHVLVTGWQRDHGLITEEVEAQVQAGFDQLTPKESPETENLVVFRIMSLLDLMVFRQGGSAADQDRWRTDFPETAPLAFGLFGVIMDKPLDAPTRVRRTVVNLFKMFEEIVQQLGYEPPANTEFVSLPPILSPRQLRLSLNQLFDLKHSDFRNRETKHRGYVALGKGDDQNAFVLPLVDPKPEDFRKMYQQPLEDILKKYDVLYGVRN
ncbi:hypothetical protein [Lacticaseibacillus mingshuiensis]|uniref:IpaB/EvcA family protein n=1 Tax=Lacticaseibacillus mingshuiensis TaxID=2799574 RepID=A0ABW4CIR6_9LACO|nr:hypothetical protein [Lacticaseibacillus mingshuiensis]